MLKAVVFRWPICYLGSIAAIVQFFVDMFNKSDPPPSPSEKFYSDYVKDYVKKLTVPLTDFDSKGQVPAP